ncbi:unnamed protein product [Ixodes persulcatus]
MPAPATFTASYTKYETVNMSQSNIHILDIVYGSTSLSEETEQPSFRTHLSTVPTVYHACHLQMGSTPLHPRTVHPGHFIPEMFYPETSHPKTLHTKGISYLDILYHKVFCLEEEVIKSAFHSRSRHMHFTFPILLPVPRKAVLHLASRIHQSNSPAGPTH